LKSEERLLRQEAVTLVADNQIQTIKCGEKL